MREIDVIALGRRISTELDAIEFLERIRWNGEPFCPVCGDGPAKDIGPGLATNDMGPPLNAEWFCYSCDKSFSVLTGTALDQSRIPIRTWLLVMFEIISTHDHVTSYEVERNLNVTASTAWYMLHRLRCTMRQCDGEMFPGLPLDAFR